MEGGDTAHQVDKSTVGRKGYSTWWQIKGDKQCETAGHFASTPKKQRE